MVVPTFTKKEKLETGENFKEEKVVWVFNTLSLSCLSDSLVQLYSAQVINASVSLEEMFGLEVQF